MDEVRNISPERLVSRTQPNRRAETVGLHAHPDVADVFGRKLAFGTAGVQLAFERIERDLSDDRVQHVLDFGREHRAAARFVLGLVEQRAEGQHLAEHGGGFGERQRCGRHERTVRRGKHLVHAMAELMRERHHVARLTLIV